MKKIRFAAAGASSHIRSADDPKGLPGKVKGPIKITMMGAGSFFTSSLMNDVLRIPGAEHGHIALVDIDAKRLKITHGLIANLIAHLGKAHWKVSSTTRRREALPGSDYIVNCIEVSGTACVRFDNDIPMKYGVDQCIGDTTGPGGLFKGLRTIPVFLEVLKDAEELCPRALVLNYTNPMSMMCLAAGRSSSMQVVGLCHSVQGTSHLLAKRAEVPYEEMNFECAGVNHLAWFTRLEHKGKDLYPKLKAMARQDLAGKPSNKDDAWDRVRKDLMLQFGAFTTEGSGHNSEYLPYYRKRKDVMKTYCGAGYEGGSRFYATNWPRWRKEVDQRRLRILQGKESIDTKRSWEYASWIIEAHQKDVPYRIFGNVMNSKDGSGPLISNLPTDGCVELACMIDGQGIHPTRYGKLPAQMAGVCDSNMRMFDLGAQAAIERSKEMAIHALMLDPLTSAVCSLKEIRKMTEELFKAEKPYLKSFR
jgi:alpha-galactosidase